MFLFIEKGGIVISWMKRNKNAQQIAYLNNYSNNETQVEMC